MKVSIIGAGNVGAASAFAVLYTVKPDELVLIDQAKDLVAGQVLDLSHAAVAISPKTKIAGGTDYSLTKNSDFVVITAGKARTPEIKTRDELFEINKTIVKSICSSLEKYTNSATILVVTNPSTKIAQAVKECLHKQKVVAMDKQLDSARLKYYLGQELGILPTDVLSEVAGEHGENMGFEIRDAVTYEVAEKVKKRVRESGSTIIAQKGHTNWGIASQVAKEIQTRGDAE